MPTCPYPQQNDAVWQALAEGLIQDLCPGVLRTNADAPCGRGSAGIQPAVICSCTSVLSLQSGFKHEPLQTDAFYAVKCCFLIIFFPP